MFQKTDKLDGGFEQQYVELMELDRLLVLFIFICFTPECHSNIFVAER